MHVSQSNKSANKFSTSLVAALGFAATLGLSGCSDSSESNSSTQSSTTVAPSAPTQQNAMDVKQPAPDASAKAPLVAEKPIVPVVEPEVTEQSANEDLKEIESEADQIEKSEGIQPQDTPNGASIYSTCMGCHGAGGEGGVGPKLAGQLKADLIAKLHRYKAGEQVGPMTGMMAPMAQPLSDADIDAVADYISTL